MAYLIDSTSLVAYYKFEGNANDYLGSYNATSSNVSYATTYGKYNQGGTFNGTSSTFLSATRPLDLPAALSIGGWFYFNNASDFQTLFGLGGSSGGYGYKVLHSDGSNANPGTKLTFNFPLVKVQSSGATIASTGWHHVFLTRASGTWRIYLDSVVGTTTITDTPQTPNQSMHIGSNYEAGAASNYFDGYIDDVSFWTRALSAAEILTLYSSTTPLEGGLLNGGFFAFM